MADLGGSLKEVFRSPHALAAVRDHFANLDVIAAETLEVEKVEREGTDVLHYVLKGQKHAGYGFQPDYRVRYTLTGDVLTWTPVEPGNLKNRGTARFVATATGTEIHWDQSIAIEAPVPRFLMGVIAPVVEKIMQPAMRKFVENLIASVR